MGVGVGVEMRWLELPVLVVLAVAVLAVLLRLLELRVQQT